MSSSLTAAKWLLLLAAATCFAATDSAKMASLSRVRRIAGNASRVSDSEKSQVFASTVSLVTSFKKKGSGFFSSRYSQSCAANIINNNHVITAAHCVADENGNLLPKSKWRLHMVGVKRLPNMMDRLAGWVVKKSVQISRAIDVEPSVNFIAPFHAHGRHVFIHPNYNKGDSWLNDLAILRTSPMMLDKLKQHDSVALPPPAVVASAGPQPGEVCEFAGWGCRNEGGSMVHYLMKTKFNILPLSRCTRTYSRVPELWNNVLCAQAANTSLCSGDSGSGLICYHEGQPYLAGIASSSAKGSKGFLYPSNFMKVSGYMDWIKEVNATSKPSRFKMYVNKLVVELPKWIGR